VGNEWGNATDPVESALADFITKASAAARFDVVGQLARELVARRLDTRQQRAPAGRSALWDRHEVRSGRAREGSLTASCR
jgi:hypothetical protein